MCSYFTISRFYFLLYNKFDIIEQTESKTSAELSHQGEKTNDLSDSDEELLSDLAREDLIRDTLSNAGKVHSYSHCSLLLRQGIV